MAAVEQRISGPATLQRLRRGRVLMTSMTAVALGLAAGAVLIAVAGGDPVAAYRDIIQGAFGSSYAIGQLLTVSTPLLIIGLGLAFAFRGRVYNIGAEGQLLMGALAGGAVAILLPAGTGIVLIPLSLAVGALAGGGWGLIVGVLRTRLGVNEVISSLLLNYVALYIFLYIIRIPLRDTNDATLTGKAVQTDARLPEIGTLSVHIGVFLALALIPAAMYVMDRTPFGFRVRMLGLNPEASRTVGVPVGALIVRLMVISGGWRGWRVRSRCSASTSD